MEYFDIQNPKANQILVWSDIEGAFINVDPATTTGSITGGLNFSNQGSNIYHDVSSGNMRFKSIVGGNSITLNDFNTYIEIDFDGDAETLNGLSSTDFLQTTNNLSDVDVIAARDNLNVYSVTELHDQFMETNASNIPDLDNTYDLGANGRRYADIYAKTFHGNATSSSLANQLSRNNALDGQVLTWADQQNKWVPVTPTPMTLSGALDVYTDTLQDRSLLRYNANRNRWEPDNSESAGRAGSGGAISDIENLGNGLGVYKDRTGFVANYRSLRAGNDISLNYNFNEDEIVISAVVPQTTDDLREGDSNLYYTPQRFDAKFAQSSVRALSDVQGGTPSINQTLVWNGSGFTFRTIVVDVANTDDIPEGVNNLYYSNSRVENVIQNFFQGSGFRLTDLSDVNATHQNGDILISDGGTWKNSALSLSLFSDVNISNISDGDGIVWNNATSTFITQRLPSELFDLNETPDSEHFNTQSFNTKLSSVNSDDINEGSTNFYLRESTLIPLLNNASIGVLTDVNTDNITNNSGLRWASASNSFVAYDTPVNLIDLNETSSSQHFNTQSFNSKLSSATTDDITEGTNNLYFSADKFETEFNNSSILNLVDVNGVSLDDGYVLSWSSAENEFVAVSITTLSSDVNELNDLSDISYNVVNMNDGDILSWDSTTNRFTNSTPLRNLTELNDVTLTNVAEDDTLVFENGVFINKAALPFELSSPTLNQILTWDGDKFVNANLSIAGNIDLNIGDLNDVNIDYANAQTGEGLIWDSSLSSFITTSLESYIDIDNINGMDIGSIQVDDSIRWDGVNFTPTKLPFFNPQSFTDSSVMVYNNANNAFISTDIWSLLNIDNTNTNEGHVFIYNSFNNEYVSRQLLINDVNGINDPIEVKQDGGDYVLRWDSAAQEYLIHKPRIIVNTLNDLNDVAVENLQDWDVIVWDSNEGVFTNSPLHINDIRDVAIDSIEVNQTLVWNGTAFINEEITFDTMSLTDVNASNISNGQVLTWDSSNNEFVSEDLPRNIVDLNGITLSNIQNDDILSWDGSQFINRDIFNISELGDVVINSIGVNQSLVWNGTAFINEEITFDTMSLTDVNASNISNGQVLTWDSTNNEFISENLPRNIVDLNGISLSNVQNDDILSWNGSQFINRGVFNISELSGVVVNTLTNGQTLVWNSSENNWVNGAISFSVETLTNVFVTEINDGDVIVWDDTLNLWVNKPKVSNLTDLNDVSLATGSNSPLVWNGSQLIVAETISNVKVDNITHSLTDVSTATITPGDALYQTITPLEATTYTIEDMNDLDGAYKFTIIMDNPNDLEINISSETGTIEYVGGGQANYNGKYLIEALTIDGSNWILQVSDPIS